MASNSDILDDIGDNFLLCSICLSQFKDPKLLPCLHRFCSGCLKTLICKNGIKIKCPLCQKNIIVPNEGFKTDFYVNGIIEYVQFKKSLKTEITKKCYGCSLDLPVIAYCFKCNNFLCQSCRDIHMTNNIAKEHRPHVLELCDADDSNLSMDKLDSLKDAPKCHTHPEKIADLCCKSCNSLPICMVCGSYGEHKQHDLHEVTLLAKEERKRLGAKLATLMKLKDKVYNMARVMSAKKTKLDTNVIEREKMIMTEYKGEEKKIKSEIVKLQTDFKMQKVSLSENLQKVLSNNKKELEEMIRLLTEQYKKISAEKMEDNDKMMKTIQEASDREITQRHEKLEMLKNSLDEINKSIKVHQEGNHEIIKELSDYHDNILKRFQNLTITANSILNTKHDWTSVQSIPDIFAAVDPLITDAKIEFPNFATLQEVIDVKLPTIEMKPIIKMEITSKASDAVIQIVGFNEQSRSIHCITNCGSIIILSGNAECKTHITAINMDGVNLFETLFDLDHDMLSPRRCCNSLSSNQIATVSKPTEIGIYELFVGSRITKNTTKLIRKWPENQSVLCVAVDPVKKCIIVGTNTNDIYVFDNTLNYKYTVTLPARCSCSREIVFHEGNLLICDTIEREAFAVSIQGSKCKEMYKFARPESEQVDSECWPRSICVDTKGSIYILWTANEADACRCSLVRYKRYGGKQHWSRSVDSDASCITTAVNSQGVDTLLLATLNSGKLYTYDLNCL